MQPTGALAGQSALVTGASRGIGRAIALMLAREGVALTLLGRRSDALEDTRAMCQELGARAVLVPCDLRRPEDIEPGVAAAVAAHGRLDYLINDAGVGGKGSVLDADLALWDECLLVNLTALMHLTRHAAPHLVKSGRGGLVSIASIAARTSYASGGAYVASKHAVLGFTEAAFEDLREHGVKVSTICPGFVDTSMVTNTNLDRTKMLTPDDVADAVRYVLCSSLTCAPTEIVLRPLRTPYR